MSVETWDKSEIKKLTLASGKPLEVQCAEAFIAARWKVRLGTFYTDISTEKIRELDFLAERDFPFSSTNVNHDLIRWTLRLRILGSCKGFPPENAPATYSIPTHSLSCENPALMCYECGIHGRAVADRMRSQSAEHLLRHAKLQNSQQIVGFDIFEREEVQQRKGEEKKAPQFRYSRNGDRILYEGLDSAVKAAIFWYREDKRQARFQIGGDDQGYIALNIPLLVTSIPFWEVSIEKGTAGEPALRSSGFHVGLYPSGDIERAPEAIMSVVWQATTLRDLTDHLNGLINSFVDDVQDAVKKA